MSETSNDILQNSQKIGEENKKAEFIKNLEGKNINLLIGAGASLPFLNSLKLDFKANEDDKNKISITFEDLLEKAYDENNDELKDYLCAYFLEKSLKNGIYSNICKCYNDENTSCKQVLDNYIKLIKNLYNIIQRNSIGKPKRVNIFSTNYDMFFERAFDLIIRDNHNIYFNDGSYGFIDKTISTERFHMKYTNVGVDNKFEYELPMFNLLKLHGSLNWESENIETCTRIKINNELLESYNNEKLTFEEFESLLSGDYKDNKDFFQELDIELTVINDNRFHNYYKKLDKLSIVKPMKKKFSDTVFMEHYFQGLRILTQELERKQTVVIAFGFSFNDEHILSIIKRSLLNPELMLYIICYDDEAYNDIKLKFEGYNNICFIRDISKACGDFNFFNDILTGGKYYEYK